MKFDELEFLARAEAGKFSVAQHFEVGGFLGHNTVSDAQKSTLRMSTDQHRSS